MRIMHLHAFFMKTNFNISGLKQLFLIISETACKLVATAIATSATFDE